MACRTSIAKIVLLAVRLDQSRRWWCILRQSAESVAQHVLDLLDPGGLAAAALDGLQDLTAGQVVHRFHEKREQLALQLRANGSAGRLVFLARHALGAKLPEDLDVRALRYSLLPEACAKFVAHPDFRWHCEATV